MWSFGSCLESSISDPVSVSPEKQMRVVPNLWRLPGDRHWKQSVCHCCREACLSPVETLRGRKNKSQRWFLYPSGFAHFTVDLVIACQYLMNFFYLLRVRVGRYLQNAEENKSERKSLFRWNGLDFFFFLHRSLGLCCDTGKTWYTSTWSLSVQFEI